MTPISTTTIAMTRRTWMNPPIVYELTKPTAQRTSRITAMVQSIFLTSCRVIATFFHCLELMLILSDGRGHRHLSEMRIAVCLILGPVFVLWLSLIHISEPTRLGMISYAVFC